tara:strand:- start:26070 stop:26231 length:162 start_codon:yes stop_codon:yes gene_type:complete
MANKSKPKVFRGSAGKSKGQAVKPKTKAAKAKTAPKKARLSLSDAISGRRPKK